MSRLPQARPSSSGAQQGAGSRSQFVNTKISKTTIRRGSAGPGGPGGSAAPGGAAGAKRQPAEQAFSRVQRLPVDHETEFEKLKKKNVRRNVAAGEDIKQIREVIRGLKGQDNISVQEFVGLVSQYTGDNGVALRGVMADELSAFRKIALGVYENMTQDVSDVLANEHEQLSQFNQERITHFTNKMMQAIDEIFAINPNFDFDKYYRNPKTYLATEFPIPIEHDVDPEEIELQKRQLAYHRLQWLRSEGERLHSENKRLQERLTQLKREQQEQQRAAARAEQDAEQRRQQLEAAQAQMQDKLEDLNNSVEKSIVDNERLQRQNMERESKATFRSKKPDTKKPRAKPQWNVKAATEIEGITVGETIQAEISQVSVKMASSSKAGLGGRKSRDKMKRPQSQQGQQRRASPFHFSPIKTPPDPRQRPARSPSPFHYSPPRTPPELRQGPSTSRRTPPGQPNVQTITRVESTTVITETAPGPSARPAPRGRRNLAPRDSWGGYQ